MTEQLIFTLVFAFLSGVALCVVLILIKNRKITAGKRKETARGLVKVAGAGLVLKSDEEDIEVFEVGSMPADPTPLSETDAPVDVPVVAAAPVDAPTNARADVSADVNVPADDSNAVTTCDAGADTDGADVSAGNSGAADVNTPAGDTGVSNLTVIKRRIPETVKMKERKVLLVEDITVNRELIAAFFDGSGIKLDFAENGLEACEKFEANPNHYSLILMDVQMPVMDGYEATRRIRTMDTDWAKQIPIIAMTGNTFKEDIDLCFDAGMDDHVSKPISAEILQNKVFDFIAMGAD